MLIKDYPTLSTSIKKLSFLFRISIILLLLIASKSNGQSIRIIGRVFDANEGKALEYAIVSALNSKDSLIGGGLTQNNGDFILENLPRTNLTIKLQSIGFETRIISITTIPNQSLYDMGNIRLQPSQQQLKAVNIEAEKSQMTLGIDRRTYNVDKDLSAKGGSALDAMKNIPGINVGSDNSVQLRNQAPTIFVDGRPTLLSLDQIPADEIDRIEVITNPSAQYAADATGGILNVVMKKNLKPGYFGMISAGIGSNNRYSTNGNVTFREKKFSLQLSGNFGTSLNNNDGFTSRENYNNGIVNSSFLLNNTNITERTNSGARIAADYQLNVRSLLSANYSFFKSEMNSNERQNYNTRDSLNQIEGSGNRLNELTNKWSVQTAQLSFKKNFPKPKKELNADLNLIYSANTNDALFKTNNSTLLVNPQLNDSSIQNNYGDRSAILFTGQFDFTNPINEKSRFDWGSRISYKKSNSDFSVKITDPESGIITIDTGISNRFIVDDFIGAAYINYVSKWRNIGYQAGLRYEHTRFVAQLTDSQEEFSFIYPKQLSDLSKVLFPAIYFSRKIKEIHEFQLNFSRKIGRPGYMQLIPFITYADRQSIQIGNPVLAPEFINLAEFNYSFQGKKSNLLSGIYMRNTLNSITTVIYPSTLDPDILISTYGNGRNKMDYGFENTFKQTLFAWLDGNINTNLFYSKISLDQGNTTISNEGISWNAKAALNIKANKKLSFQLNGSYEAPRIIAQGTITAIWFCDASCNYTFSKKLSMNATLSDVFNTKNYGTNFLSSTFSQETIRRWEARYFRFNITWKFGEPDVSLFKRRSNSRREPGSGGTEMQEM
jgi:hypothetical protein